MALRAIKSLHGDRGPMSPEKILEKLEELGVEVCKHSDIDPRTYVCRLCLDQGIVLRTSETGVCSAKPCKGPEPGYCKRGARIAVRWADELRNPRYQEEPNEIIREGFEPLGAS